MTHHEYLTDDLRDTVLAYALGTLPAEEEHAFTAHAKTGCRLCTQELETLQRTLGLFGHTAPIIRPQPHVRARLFAAITAEVASTPTPSPQGVVDFYYVHASAGTWRSLVPGVQVKLLFTDPQTNRSTAIIRMAPGTRLPRHHHLGVEELFVLEGDCHVMPDQILHAGDYFRAEAGSLHDTTFTETGTTFLALYWNEFPA
jgi:quercetin dioxygenase-like cupin family protein